MRICVAVAVVGLAGAAHAACNIDEAGVDARHDALAAERGELTAPARSSLATLRRAAEQLSQNGHAIACGEVVDTASQLLEDGAAWTAEVPPAEPTGKMNLVTFAATEQAVESTALVGKPLNGREGGLLGIIDGVLLDQTRDASHLVVRRDGIWGAASEIAVPSERILVDPATGDLFAEIAVERLAEAPRYDRADWEIAANDPWYDAEAAKAVDAAEARAMADRRAEQDASDSAMSGTIPAAASSEQTATREETQPGTDVPDGPKRIRVEKDRPESAQGSSD